MLSLNACFIKLIIARTTAFWSNTSSQTPSNSAPSTSDDEDEDEDEDEDDGAVDAGGGGGGGDDDDDDDDDDDQGEFEESFQVVRLMWYTGFAMTLRIVFLMPLGSLCAAAYLRSNSGRKLIKSWKTF